MRTSLRTYHPVPSLQKSEGNLQDAPRIKNILKSCLLPTEQPNEQQTAADILAKSVSHQQLRRTSVQWLTLCTCARGLATYLQQLLLISSLFSLLMLR